jgi:hypothetical protein
VFPRMYQQAVQKEVGVKVKVDACAREMVKALASRDDVDALLFTSPSFVAMHLRSVTHLSKPLQNG